MSPFESRRDVAPNGGTEGIGYHRLPSLGEGGCRVARLDIDGEHVQPHQEKRPEQVPFLECDVAEDADVETAVEAIFDERGQIDIPVDNTATTIGTETKRGSGWIEGVRGDHWP